MAAAAALGYDPRPDLTAWRGTPIPPVDHPLPRTDELWRIADRVWWNGPPWTVLRNADRFLWSVMDYGSDDDIAFVTDAVDESLWRRAIANARPGFLSKGSYVVWSLRYGLIELDDPVSWWPGTAHIRDCRPLANESRERMYARHAHGRNIRNGRCAEPDSAGTAVAIADTRVST